MVLKLKKKISLDHPAPKPVAKPVPMKTVQLPVHDPDGAVPIPDGPTVAMQVPDTVAMTFPFKKESGIYVDVEHAGGVMSFAKQSIVDWQVTGKTVRVVMTPAYARRKKLVPA